MYYRITEYYLLFVDYRKSKTRINCIKKWAVCNVSHNASKALLHRICLCSWVVAFKADSRTTRVRVSPAAKRFRQMHAKINIFYTVLVQNIENRKLHRQVGSVDAGLNRESQ